MAVTGLFIDVPAAMLSADGVDLLGDAGRAYLERMRLAAVPVVLTANSDAQLQSAMALCPANTIRAGVAISDQQPAWPKPGRLQRLAHEHDIDVFTSWLICADPQAVTAAASAGFIGAVLLEHAGEPPKTLIACKQARDIADAPRVMIPPKGGCWHDHQ